MQTLKNKDNCFENISFSRRSTKMIVSYGTEYDFQSAFAKCMRLAHGEIKKKNLMRRE